MNIHSFLTPAYLQSIKGLELLARITVDTFHSGLNVSQKVGLGQEFSQYRSYQKGDDIRLLDWKVYARTERYYIREADLQSHVRLKFIVDISASMLHEDRGIRKIDYANYLTATLAYLGTLQGDEIGLSAVNTNEWKHIPSGLGDAHFSRILYEIIHLQPKGKLPVHLAPQRVVPDIRRKELYIVISDMYELEDEWHKLLRQLAASSNEVILFHVLGKNEWDLDYPSATFTDLETHEQIQVNPDIIRKNYQQALNEKIESTRKNMRERGIFYELMLMDTPAYQAITQFLLGRKHLLS